MMLEGICSYQTMAVENGKPIKGILVLSADGYEFNGIKTRINWEKASCVRGTTKVKKLLFSAIKPCVIIREGDFASQEFILEEEKMDEFVTNVSELGRLATQKRNDAEKQKRREEEERKRIEAEEQRKHEEEERKRIEAEEKRKREDEERRRIEVEEQRKREEEHKRNEVEKQDETPKGVLYQPGTEPSTIKKQILQLCIKLNEAYPDKVIVGLHKDHKHLGEKVTELYRKLGYPDGNAFLYAYGYKTETASHGRPVTVSPEDFIARLKERYPGGTNKSIKELQTENPDLPWKSVQNKASEFFGTTLSVYLKKEGIFGTSRAVTSSGENRSAADILEQLALEPQKTEIETDSKDKLNISPKGVPSTGKSLSDSDKPADHREAAIEQFVSEHQRWYAYYKTIQEDFSACSGDTLSKWVKTIYGQTAAEFFRNRGVIVSLNDDLQDWCESIIKRLKSIYSKKEPANHIYQLRTDNPDMPIEAFVHVLNYDFAKPFRYEKYVWLLFDYGILKNPIETDLQIQKLIESSFDTPEMRNMKGHPALSIDEIKANLNMAFFGTLSFKGTLLKDVFKRFPQVFNCSMEEYYRDKRLLLPEKEAKLEARKQLKEVAKRYPNPIPWPEQPRSYFSHDLLSYYRSVAEKQGMNEAEAANYVKQMFIDAGIVKGVMSPAALEVKEEKSKQPSVEGSLYQGQWYYSTVPMNASLVALLDNGKEYKYRATNKVDVGDYIVIGKGFQSSGQMAKVKEVLPSSAIKKGYTAVALYSFSKSPTQKEIKNVSKTVNGYSSWYAKAGEAVLCTKGSSSCVDFMVGRLLSAATVLACPELAKSETIAEARVIIENKKTIPGSWYGENYRWEYNLSGENIPVAPTVPIVLFSGYYPAWEKDFFGLNIWKKIEKLGAQKTKQMDERKLKEIQFCYDEEGGEADEDGDGIYLIGKLVKNPKYGHRIYGCESSDFEKLIDEDVEYHEACNELIFRSALSILIHGDLANLLDAFLSAKPPISSFASSLVSYARECGSKECLGVLEKHGIV